ncbi:MAG: type II secretion system protein [Candidatus Gastranaerophilales bacterium]|nr:type II secretion system protein [Candidatus Gastranaerophilales bacterium]
MKKGFTIAEVLVTLTILGVIATLTIPVVTQSMSAQYKQLYKAAFQNVESIVSELINDTALYPNGEFTTNADFCKHFAEKVNTIGYDSDNCDGDSFTTNPPDSPNFVTTNGMKWYIMDVDDRFETTCPDSVSPANDTCLHIYVDVNGSKGKNTNTGADTQRDILGIFVSKTGKLYVPEYGEGPERCYMIGDSSCPY